MFFVKPMGTLEIFSVKEADISFVKHLWSYKVSYPVVSGISCDGGDAEQRE